MPSISLIIPAYNEECRLPRTLQHLAGYVASADGLFIHEIIIVDDGSADRTSAVAASWQDRLPITVVRLAKNMGKGAALRAGILQASGDFVLLYDADASIFIEELDVLYRAMVFHRADIAIGSRVGKERDEMVQMQRHRRIIGRTYHMLTCFLIPGIRDAACGFKLLKKDVAQRIFSEQTVNRFAYDVEILALALQQRCRICEVSIRWKSIPDSRVRIIRDGIEMSWQVMLLYFRFFSRARTGEAIQHER